jgi:hypothetical protein
MDCSFVLLFVCCLLLVVNEETRVRRAPEQRREKERDQKAQSIIVIGYLSMSRIKGYVRKT